MSVHDRNRKLVMQDVDEVFQRQELSQEECPGLLGEIRYTLGQFGLLVATLRIRNLINEKLREDPNFHLCDEVKINEWSFFIRQEEGAPPQLDEGSWTKEVG